MSLINQMLQDLENRQAKRDGDKRSDFADGLTSVTDYETGKGFLNKRMLVYLVIFAVLLIGVVFMRSGKKPVAVTSVKMPEQTQQAQTSEVKNPFGDIKELTGQIKEGEAEAHELASTVQGATSGATSTKGLPTQETAATTAQGSTKSAAATEKTQPQSQASLQEQNQEELAAAEDSNETDITIAKELVETEAVPYLPASEMVKLTISPIIKGQQSVTFYFSSGFKYEFSTNADSGNEVVLTFENTNVPNAILPKLEEDSFITEVGLLKQSEKVEFIFELADDVFVTGVETEKSGFPQKLVINFRGPAQVVRQQTAGQASTGSQDEIEETPGEMTRVIKPLTPQEQLQVDYEIAMNELSQNKISSAMEKLHDILKEHPNHLQTRSDLMTLYFEKRDYQKVQSLLSGGLQRDPYYPPFVMMQARLFMIEGDNQQALTMLKTIRPDLVEYPDFYATLGTLEQQLGNYQVAAQVYLELVRIEPEQGRWWLGYGLALEALGKRNVALQAYEKSIATDTLPIDLEAYVKGRIDALGG